MPRYFIRDPLEAALAAKNHGFKFKDGHTECLRLHREWMSVYDLSMVISHVPGWGKFYIADESLALMEPIKGDLIKSFDGSYQHVFEGPIYEGSPLLVACIGRCLPPKGSPIILRNNLPFPKIEVDDE